MTSGPNPNFGVPCLMPLRLSALDSVRPRPAMSIRQELLAKSLSEEVRPSSVPPPALHPRRSLLSSSRPSSIPPSGTRHSARLSPPASEAHFANDRAGREPAQLDLIDLLQRSEPSVVKTRTGSVLSRGFILKTDHYPSGTYITRVLY